MWKTLYNGYIEKDVNGNSKQIKLNLEQAAEKVGISKKSLDDYLIQLKIGRIFGFNFNEHKNDKVGVLRAFVKYHRKKYENKKNELNKNNNNNDYINDNNYFDNNNNYLNINNIYNNNNNNNINK